MAHRNNNPFTMAGVLARMNEFAGSRYQCSKLARTFKVRPHDMRIMLNKLLLRGLIKDAVEGSDRRYWAPTKAELDLAEQVRYIKPWTPLAGYEKKMRDFAEMAQGGR